MSTRLLSRTLLVNPFADPHQPSLADTIEELGSADLQSRRRQDMVSGIRTFARIAGKEPASLPAHPGFLGRVAATCRPHSTASVKGAGTTF